MKITQFDAETQETTILDMNEEDLLIYEKEKVIAVDFLAKEKAAYQEKQKNQKIILEKLGITEEEVKLLLS